MSDDSKIEWTDATWNPIRGCSRVSAGCARCYAERVAARFSGPGQPYEGLAVRKLRVVSDDEQTTVGRWTGTVRMVPEHLADPLRWRRPRRVFVNSMSDLFHESLTNEQIAAVFGVMASRPRHSFQVLTKRARRMREFMTHPEVKHWIAKATDAALVEADHDPRERWAAINGFPGYEASSHGRIRSDNGVLSTQINPATGRESLTLWNGGAQKTMPVHLLVMAAFNHSPDADGEVCHRNGNKLDNRLANLRRGTRSENQQEKVRHGARGGPQKLTPAQVAEIRLARAGGEKQQSIAERFGVSRSLVSMIESGRVWSEPEVAWPLPNVWLGVSVENQAAADERIPELLRTPAAVRWISAEPLLGPVDVARFMWPVHWHWQAGYKSPEEAIAAGAFAEQRRQALVSADATFIDWIVAGCESGPGARPCDVAWLRSLRDQCAPAGTAFFLKQAVEGGDTPIVTTNGERAPAITAGPDSHRKAGGVIGLPYLDGKQHAAMPGATR